MNTESPTGPPLEIHSIPSPFTTVEGAVLWAQILAPGTLEGPSRKSEKLKRNSGDELEKASELKSIRVKLYYRGMYDQVTYTLDSGVMGYTEDIIL